MKFFISIVLILFMLCIVGLSGFVLWGSKGSVRVGRVPLDVLEVGSGPLKHSGEVRHLSFLSWNIAFLYGEGSEGTGYTPKDEEFYYQKLDKMESIFQKYPFDIGFFQEVDLDAERSHGMDQSVGLQWKGGQFYGSSILSWDVRYMPFPYFPFSSHWGKIRSGGAITSHFPLDEGFAQILEKPDYNWFYRSFYLHRYIQEAVISVDGIKYMIFNVHLEAFDQKNRQAQIAQLVQRVMEAESVGKKVIAIGGDFNCAQDSDCDQMNQLQNFMLANTQASFPSSGPKERLDRIYVSKKWAEILEAQTLQVGEISDHLPIQVRVKLKVGETL